MLKKLSWRNSKEANERVLEYADKNKKSNMLRHTLQSSNPSVQLNEIKIIGKGFNNNRVKSKISEALSISGHYNIGPL